MSHTTLHPETSETSETKADAEGGHPTPSSADVRSLGLEPISSEVNDDPWGLVGEEFDGGLQVESVVGAGGFGTVYRAYHSRFRAPVALKVLRLPEHQSSEQRTELLRRFEQETVILFRLSRLTLNVASCLAAGTFTAKDGTLTPYIIQEWLQGTGLDSELRGARERDERYTLRQVIELLDPAVEALSVAHEQGVVHRDVKPSNLFLVQRDDATVAKLLDFGIAKLLNDDLGVGAPKSTMLQAFRVLSVDYAAPEQWDEQLGPLSPKTDLFSLALVVVEMLTGAPALEGTGAHALLFSTLDPLRRPSPRHKGFEIPDAIEDHFLSALAVNPVQRCASLQQWWSNLEHLAATHPAWSSARLSPVAQPTAMSPLPTAEPDRATPVHVTAVANAVTRGAKRERRRKLGWWVTGSALSASVALLAAVALTPPRAGALATVQPSTPTRASVVSPGDPEPPYESAFLGETAAAATATADTTAPEPTPSATERSTFTTSNVGHERPETNDATQRPGPRGSSSGGGAASPGRGSESVPSTTGQLRLNSIPASAILIDGRPIGSTPKKDVHLSPGPHNVVFVHPELGKRRLLVLVEAGKSQTLSVKF